MMIIPTCRLYACLQRVSDPKRAFFVSESGKIREVKGKGER